MSAGNELHSSDAETGNVRRPTVDGTSSWSEDDDQSRRRPGKSATRTN